MSNDDAREPSRRTFIDWALRLTVVAWVGAMLVPVGRWLAGRFGGGDVVRLSPAEAAKLSADGSILLEVEGERIILFHHGDDQLGALSARCTHQACTVKWVASEGGLWCPCHNGRFDPTGAVRSGPPPKPLQRYEVRHEVDGTIVVVEATSA